MLATIAQYAVLPPLFDLISSGKVRIGQLQLEMHEWPTTLHGLHDFFSAADRAKLRVFHKERNHWGCEGYRCVEYAFVSESFLREANGAAICPSRYLPLPEITAEPGRIKTTHQATPQG